MNKLTNAMLRVAAAACACVVSVLLLAAVVSIGEPDKSRLNAAIAARQAARTAQAQVAAGPERLRATVAYRN
jgi:hypothetical protein